jgi:CHAT domain-containing protein
LAVGDPSFDSRARNTTLSVPPDEPPPRPRETEFARLPAAERELRALARVFPASTVLTGTRAGRQSLDKLLEEGRLEQFRYLHFATHGVLDVQSPMRSALILAHDPSAKESDRSPPDAPTTDNRLTAEQILRSWKLDADLVTLSACETGLGKFSGGEGYVGFSQALFLSGARSLILSLWRVDDNSTALLMTRFYENLMGTRGAEPPLPKALALAEAKRWLRGLTATQIEQLAGNLSRGLDTGQTRGKRVTQPAAPPGTPTASHPYDHPYYWSGFILIGDPY